jgi:hypothetical protein
MLPTLIALGPIIIRSFGVCLALGLFFGGFVFWKKGREEGVTEEELMDSWLLAALSAFLFSRAGFVLSHWNEFNNWYRILFFTKFPGLSYAGALCGFWLILTFLIIKKRWPVWPLLETAVFSEIVAEIFGWLGRWLAAGAWRWPWELIRAAILIITYLSMTKWEKEYRNLFQPGALLAVYLAVSGGLELGFRHYWEGGILLLAGLLLLINRWGKLGKLKINLFKRKIPTKDSRKKIGFDWH